jgi:hypothetical protein
LLVVRRTSRTRRDCLVLAHWQEEVSRSACLIRRFRDQQMVGGLVIVAAGVWVAANWIDDLLDKPKTCSDCDEAARCRRIKRTCIEKCSDEELPTWPRTDQGMPFFKCVNQCLENSGCAGF